MSKEEVLKRLRAAGEADPKGVKAGRAFGRQWAEENANPRLLRQVAGMVNAPAPVDEEAPPGFSPLCCHLLYTIADTGSFDDAEAYCKSLGTGGIYLMEHEDFAIGFIKGANDVWGEVGDQM